MTYNLLCGDSLEKLKTLPDCSVNMCVTSPPYYGLRDYGTGTWIGGDPNCTHTLTHKRVNSRCGVGSHSKMGDSGVPIGNDTLVKSVCPICGAVRVDMQVGLEETPEQYIERLVSIFREVRRVLKDDGALWVNIGDTYNVSSYRKDENSIGHGKQVTNQGSYENVVKLPSDKNCKPKDLIGIPWMLAFALRADGWYLRQDIIWHKPNPMPESVKDRCTKSHEYIFLLTKSPKYYFDYEAIQEPCVTYDNYVRDRDGTKMNNTAGRTRMGGLVTNQYEMRNKRSVWTVIPSHYKEAHFATFPKELIIPCILSTSRVGDTVLDPFNGSGTSGVVAITYDRNYIGIDLNSKYIEMAKERIETECHRKLHCRLF